MSSAKTKQPRTSKEVPAPDSAAVITPATNDQEIAFDQLKQIVYAEKDTSGAPEGIDDERRTKTAQTLRERETHRKGEEDYYGLRKKWSWFIFSFITFMLLFQLALTIAIGFKVVDFEKYPIFLHLIIGENFAQIIGMGIIVAKYLFPKQP
jgi:hypothetical protein